MFARKVSITLKSNKLNEFNTIFENEVIPLLRKQPGFSDELAICSEDGTHITAISLWDNKENADKYGTAVYPRALKTIEKLFEGTPTVRNCTVIRAMSHKQVPMPVVA